jgi:hypothetical protein
VNQNLDTFCWRAFCRWIWIYGQIVCHFVDYLLVYKCSDFHWYWTKSKKVIRSELKVTLYRAVTFHKKNTDNLMFFIVYHSMTEEWLKKCSELLNITLISFILNRNSNTKSWSEPLFLRMLWLNYCVKSVISRSNKKVKKKECLL